jgi:multiple sugar transport system substrate-binding protein
MALLKDQGGPDFEGKYGVAPMPEEDSATSFVGGGDMVVFKDAENRDGAWKFVAYLSDPEVQSEFYGMVGALPSVREAWESGDLAEDPMLAMFGEQLDDAKSPPAVSTWEQVADVIDGEVEKVTVAGAGPAQAVDAMQSGAESIGMGG